MSSVTDPYQPIERKLKLTRHLLKVIGEEHAPRLVVQTRSPDVVRDVDLYKRIETPTGLFHKGRVQVNITVTTDDEDVRRTFEPWCPGNVQRIEAARRLRAEEIQTCITMTPLIWVENPEQFCDRLLASGVQRFIIQPFHFQRGRFVAGTRDDALKLMAEKLGKTEPDFRTAYEEHYTEVREVLKRRLPDVGEGKAGFSPPF